MRADRSPAASTSPGRPPDWAPPSAQRRELTDADVRAALERDVSERLTAAAEYERLGRDDHAHRLRAEADVLNRHLGD